MKILKLNIKVQFIKAVDTSFKYAYIHNENRVVEVFNKLLHNSPVRKETPAQRATKTVYRVGNKNRNYSGGGRKHKIKMNTSRKNKNKSKKIKKKIKK